MTLKLVLTCGACPEQYDVFAEDGQQIGYLRLRHGRFRAHYPDCGGEVVYEASPEGDGCFEPGERDYYLRFALDALKTRHESGPDAVSLPPAPEVDYVIEGGQ